MRLLSLSALAATLFLGLTAAPARAQDPAPPAEHEESRAYYKAGNEAFLNGDKKAARAHYLRALELERHWDIVCNLGRVEGEMGLDKEALEHLDECLKEYPPTKDKKVQQARAKFYDLRTELRDRCQRMACAYQEPTVSPGLDATPTQPNPKPTEAPGPTEAATPAKSEPTKSELEKSEKPTAPLPPEEHPAFIEKPSAKWPVVITTGALGLVGIGLGVGFHVVAEDKKGEALGLLDDLQEAATNCSRTPRDTRCRSYDSAKSGFHDARTAETVSFVAGGALATAAVVMAIVWPDRGERVTASVQPFFVVDRTGSFFGVSGKF
jgi:tetratricopeptide (TPR) repeat protein